jgi:hypothetical protein
MLQRELYDNSVVFGRKQILQNLSLISPDGIRLKLYAYQIAENSVQRILLKIEMILTAKSISMLHR